MKNVYTLISCLFLNVFTAASLQASLETPPSENLNNDLYYTTRYSIHCLKIKYSSIQPTADDRARSEKNRPNQTSNIVEIKLYLQEESYNAIVAMKKKRDCHKRLRCLCSLFCCPCISCYS